MKKGRPAEPPGLPLTPLSFQILLALAEGQRHGYGILQEIESVTEGVLHPATGTLYLALQRLVEEGLIDEDEPARARSDGDDERRRYYRLTAAGRRLAAREAERMARAVGLARKKSLISRRVLAALLGLKA